MNRPSRLLAAALSLSLILPAPGAFAAAAKTLTLPSSAGLATASPALAAQTQAPSGLASVAVLKDSPSLRSGVSAAAMNLAVALPPAVSIAPVAAPAAPAAPQAPLAALSQTQAAVAAAQPGSAEAASALNLRFDASPSKPVSAPAVAGSASSPSPLTASSVSARKARLGVPSARRTSDGGAVNVKILAIVGAVIVAIGIIVGVLIHNGNKKDAEWQKSAAAADIVSVERAQREGKADELFQLAEAARKRQAAQADAKQRAFDGLAAARAELAANEVSDDATRRMGGKRAAAWQSGLESLEKQAVANNHDGAVGRELDSLDNEVGREQKADERLKAALKTFDEQVPGVGGGSMKEALKGGRDALSRFEKDELGAESVLHARELSEARARVAARLAAGDAVFKGHLERRDALAQLANGSLKSAAELAKSIDDDLRDMGAALKSKGDDIAAAKQAEEKARDLDAEADKLAKTPKYEQAKDAQGNPMYDPQGRPVMVQVGYEDPAPKRNEAQSKRDEAKNKRDHARTEAERARTLAGNADRNLKTLRTFAQTLRDDATMKAEGLDADVPAKLARLTVYVDFYTYDLGTADVDLFLGYLNETHAQEVRSRYSGTAEGLKRAQAAAEARRAAEAAAVDKAVDDKLDSEKKSSF